MKTKISIVLALMLSSNVGLAATDLSVNLDMPDTAKIGEETNYKIMVKNAGPEKAKEVLVTYKMPFGVSFVSAKTFLGDCTVSSNEVVCKVRNLRVNSTANIRGKMIAENSGEFKSTVSVKSSEKDINPFNNILSGSFSAQPQSEMEVVLEDSIDPVKPGAEVVYTATVTNHGPNDLNQKFFLDIAFKGLTGQESSIISATSPKSNFCLIINDQDEVPTPICSFQQLNVGDSIQMKVTVRPTKNGVQMITSTVHIGEDIDDPGQFKNQAKEMTTVLGSNTRLKVITRGNGHVADELNNIDCGENCQFTYPRDSVVTLIPSADMGWKFTRWVGACAGDATACTVQMSKKRRVVAIFKESK